MENKEIAKKQEVERREVGVPNIDLNDKEVKKIYEVLLAMGIAQPAGTMVTFGATNMTEHLGLNQWAPEDVPIRTNFNDDNRKIDEAFSKLNNNLLNRTYPIGAIYLTANDANPQDLFGGEWEAWGGGRVPIGIGTNGTTSYTTPGATGGVESITLTVAQMPQHTHTQNAHTHTQNAHTHTQNAHSHILTAGHWYHTNIPNVDAHHPAGAAGVAHVFTGQGNVVPNATATNQNTTATNQNTTATNQNTGGSTAHSNMQPWITCYMWRRVA